ncbi:MAG TPA: hypothetical protein VJ788_02100 [Gemmatimonadota bacterium]|nr:hypothetical protein [Gemmatimonadota bacterium]
MEETPAYEAPPTPPAADRSPALEEEWDAAPVTKFRCPVHLVPEEWQIVSQDGQRMIRYACPIDGCGHEWTVKRLRA